MSDTATDRDRSPLSVLSESVGLHARDKAKKPTLRLEADITLTEHELGLKVSQMDIFLQNGELIYFAQNGERKVMTPLAFRSWVNERLIVYEKRDKNTDCAIPMTMSKETAATILVSEPFLQGVRELRGMNTVRLPVIRESGALELLPHGYDTETGIFTVDSGLSYDLEIDIDASKGWMRRSFGSFSIADERSFSVHVAAMLMLYIRHLPGGLSLRPGALALANKPETGKSVIAKAWQYPVLGRAPAVKLKRGEQLDKEIEAFMIAGVPAIFMDNIYGGIESATIDQMLTSEEMEGRAMGGHGLFRAKNRACLFATGNKLELNADAARRFLVVDIFEKGDPSARGINRDDILDDGKMSSPEWRSQALAVLWSFVKNWHSAGMPDGSIVRGSFETYSRLLGGIVEAAGYPPPFAKPSIPDAINPEEAEFMELMEGVLEEMGADTQRLFVLEDLARIARARRLFEREIGTQEQGRRIAIKEDRLDKHEAVSAVDRGALTDGQRGSFGKKLKKCLGDEKRVGGRTIEFGKRSQSRKSTFTVTIVG